MILHNYFNAKSAGFNKKTTPKCPIHQPLLSQPAPLASFFLLLSLPSLLSSSLSSPFPSFSSPYILFSFLPLSFSLISSPPFLLLSSKAFSLVSTRRFRLGPPPKKSRIPGYERSLGDSHKVNYIQSVDRTHHGQPRAACGQRPLSPRFKIQRVRSDLPTTHACVQPCVTRRARAARSSTTPLPASVRQCKT